MKDQFIFFAHCFSCAFSKTIIVCFMIAALAGTADAQIARTGKITGLAVIIEYQDSRTVHTRQQVDELFNRVGGIRGGNVPMSIYDYYKHFSNGRFELNHVVAPVITLPFTREQSRGDFGGIHGLWREAKKIFNTMNFDMSGVTLDNKGNPVLITMLVSGGFASTGGAGLSRTRMSADRNSIPAISFGVLAHEIGHALMRWGHPGVSADGRCLMESGWKPNPYYRHTAGWIEPVDITNAPPGTVLTLEANSHQAFIFRRNEREAYYIEAQNTGSKPQGIRGRDDSGLLIWHIDMNAGRSGVGGGGFSRVELVHADGRNDTIGDADLFRSGVATQFSGTSTPAARWHDGTSSNINITGISDAGAVMTFRIGDIPPTPINRLLWQIWPYTSGRGDVVINLDQNIMLSATLNIPRPATPGAKITIRSANSSRPVTLTRGTSGSLITVSDGAALILENIIIDGGGSNFIDTSYFDGNDNDNLYGEDIESAGVTNTDDPEDEVSNGSGTIVRVNGGAFTMNAGVVLRNNINKTANADGGAVTVLGSGTFIMNGGTISGNSVSRNGGGVFVNTGGTFTMNGGAIGGNSSQHGGGVYATGSGAVFIMNGGMISGNTASGNGGGAVVTVSAVSAMNGGEISSNRGAIGGGVRVTARGVFTLANGRINGNTSTSNAGGVSVTGAGSIFNLNRGEISGNTAGGFGGGVAMETSSTFNLNDGRIISNTAGGNGGGVVVTSSAVTAMNGGEISGNTGADGGGVRITARGVFTLANGRITGNTARATAGGVSTTGTGSKLNINGGEISGNTAGGNGGGITVTSSAVSTMTGGEISGNRGVDGGGVRISARGVFTMSNGRINGNTSSGAGGGVSLADANSEFNINGGEISSNTAGGVGGGISVTSSAVSTMTGGEISGNRGTDGGGVRASGRGVFTLANGRIINNTATSGTGGGISAAATAGSMFNLNGGVVAGTGANIAAVVSGTHNLNRAAPSNAVVIAWNRPSGTLNYTAGTNTNLTLSQGATATWANQGGVLGVSYTNGANRGWIRAW